MRSWMQFLTLVLFIWYSNIWSQSHDPGHLCIILDGVPNDPVVTSILNKHVFVFQLHNKAILYDQEPGKNKDHRKCDYKSMW